MTPPPPQKNPHKNPSNSPAFITQLKRTHYCGRLRAEHSGQSVVVMGWVKRLRNHGGMIFIDLRDHTGCVQILFKNQKSRIFNTLRDHPPGIESTAAVQGTVHLRPAGMAHPSAPAGEVEILAQHFKVLCPSQTPPFMVDDLKQSDSLALKYRYLNLRSDFLQKNLQLAHRARQVIRKTLIDHRFMEVDTPILYKTTPEGARDYLVPTRRQKGAFYALAQSPQILKQLLMIAGVDRYFQLARCFRDEDLRADRQPEFTQIDMEMSFADEQDVQKISFQLARALWKTFKNQDIPRIPSLSYDQARADYGSDRPDLRNPLKMKDISALAKASHTALFKNILQRKGVVKALAVPLKDQTFSRSSLKKIEEQVKGFGLSGLIWIQSQDLKTSAPKALEKSFLEQCCKIVFAGFFQIPPPACLIFVWAGDEGPALKAGEFLIQYFGKKLVLSRPDCFVWITQFRLLQYDEKLKQWTMEHHPFTAPAEEDLPLLMKQDLSSRPLKARAYDLVCNGQELASGSVRIHQAEVQKAVFKALGLSPKDIEAKFGFFLKALQYGAPPHAGIAWGLERLLMLLSGTNHIRDVLAFPKTTSGLCLMSSTPSVPQREQLLELGLQIADKKSFK